MLVYFCMNCCPCEGRQCEMKGQTFISEHNLRDAQPKYSKLSSDTEVSLFSFSLI